MTSIINFNGSSVVSSRIVAEVISRGRHDNTLALIRRILEEMNATNILGASEFFIESEYKYGNNNTATEYLMTQQGFTLLMFNIQGHNEFKIAYINEFERLRKENELLKQQLIESQQLLLDEKQKQLEFFAHDEWTISAIASELGTNATKIYDMCIGTGLFMRDIIEFDNCGEIIITPRWMPTQIGINAGYTKIINKNKWRITNKGREFIFNYLNK